MYEVGFIFLDSVHNRELRIKKVYPNSNMYECIVNKPSIDSYGNPIVFTCYFSKEHIDSCMDLK